MNAEDFNETEHFNEHFILLNTDFNEHWTL